MLLQKNQNELLQILLESNMDMSRINHKKNKETGTFAIHVKDTGGFTFQIRSYAANFTLYSKPPLSFSPHEASFSSNIFKWESVIIYFKQWTKIVIDEINTPDLWSEFTASLKSFKAIENVPDEKFTNNEIRELQGQLRELEHKINSSALPEAAKNALTATIQEAPEKADRFTKKEWQGWFLGAVVTQITTLALSPEHVSAVYQMLKTTFSALLLH